MSSDHSTGSALSDAVGDSFAEFGRYMKRARQRAGLSLRDAAEQADLSFGYISKVERAELGHTPSEDALRRLADTYDVDPDLTVLRAGKVPDWIKDWLVENPDSTLDLAQAIRQGETNVSPDEA